MTAFKIQVQSSGTLLKESASSLDRCPIHENSKHTLNECRSFRSRPLDERRTFIKERGYCFRCCGPKKHMRSKCNETVLCSVCKCSDHPSALHKDPDNTSLTVEFHEDGRGGLPVVSSSCTQICGKPFNTSKSCAKIVKALVYPKQKRDLARYIYCSIDDQSSNTLATSRFFECFHEYGPDHLYT